MPRPRTRPRDLFGQLLPQRRGRAEDQIQASIVDYVRRCAPSVTIAHIPNGGWRTRAEAGRFKWLGVLAGMPDLVVVLPESRVAWWEVKAPGGEQSRDQLSIQGEFLALDHDIKVVMSIDDAKAELEALGIRTREAKGSAPWSD